MNIIEFEKTLYDMRLEHYRHPGRDGIEETFRPVSGSCADFCMIEHEGVYHAFYIERRLKEGTPFYPGNEIYFGHASTPDFLDWTVHNPVMLIVPESDWECGHVWAPMIIKHGGRYVMAYTGLNYECSQDIGLAFSNDLFNWTRDPRNPISPAKDREWSFWTTERICSCRDPHLFEHEGRVYMTYTANTAIGEACVAMCSTKDLVTWEDHGPILVGAKDGYEPVFAGGHIQASLESTNLLTKNGKWYLIVNGAIRGISERHHILESDTMFRFDWSTRRQFWPDGGCVEIVKEKGTKSLLAGVVRGGIGFGEVDWSEEKPVGRSFTSRQQLEAWQD
jgi:predicted GH43/DUF377 family glycosyl hydrolase